MRRWPRRLRLVVVLLVVVCEEVLVFVEDDCFDDFADALSARAPPTPTASANTTAINFPTLLFICFPSPSRFGFWNF